MKIQVSEIGVDIRSTLQAAMPGSLPPAMPGSLPPAMPGPLPPAMPGPLAQTIPKQSMSRLPSSSDLHCSHTSGSIVPVYFRFSQGLLSQLELLCRSAGVMLLGSAGLRCGSVSEKFFFPRNYFRGAPTRITVGTVIGLRTARWLTLLTIICG